MKNVRIIFLSGSCLFGISEIFAGKGEGLNIEPPASPFVLPTNEDKEKPLPEDPIVKPEEPVSTEDPIAKTEDSDSKNNKKSTKTSAQNIAIGIAGGAGVGILGTTLYKNKKIENKDKQIESMKRIANMVEKDNATTISSISLGWLDERQISRDAKQARKAAEDQAEASEQARKVAEDQAKASDKARQAAEEQAKTSEEARQAAEEKVGEAVRLKNSALGSVHAQRIEHGIQIGKEQKNAESERLGRIEAEKRAQEAEGQHLKLATNYQNELVKGITENTTRMSKKVASLKESNQQLKAQLDEERNKNRKSSKESNQKEIKEREGEL